MVVKAHVQRTVASVGAAIGQTEKKKKVGK